jgi:hypothetical protein
MDNIFETIERRPFLAIVGLLAFHIVLACLMFWIAHSSFLANLHDHPVVLWDRQIVNPGLWNFAIDSIIYHEETALFINAINSGDWGLWWSADFSKGAETSIHVRWIALLYWLTGEKNPLIFEIVNSVTWVSSVFLIFCATRILFQKKKKIAYLSTLPLFFPSALLSSTQLLKDPFYVLGICFIIFGWVTIFHKDSQWKGALSIIIGFYLATAMRSYVDLILATSFLPCIIIFVFRKNIGLYPAALVLLSISLSLYPSDSQKTPSSFPQDQSKKAVVPLKKDTKAQQNTISDFVHRTWSVAVRGYVTQHLVAISTGDEAYKKEKTSIESLVDFINKYFVYPLNQVRENFMTISSTSSSIIDSDVKFTNIRELISYLPRAFQVGLLSPFPHQWISPGTETGWIGRAIAGLETLVVYAVLIGFISAFFIEIKIFRPLAPILIFSGIMIVLLGLTIPIAGTIYRMRQGLFIPIFILGVYGLQILSIKIKSAIRKKGNHITNY